MRFSLLFLILIFYSIQSRAAVVTKTTQKMPAHFQVFQNEGEKWRRGEKLCVKRSDKDLGCGEVVKVISESLAIARLASNSDLKSMVQVGDTVHRPTRQVSNIDGESQSQYSSKFQLSVEIGGAALYGSLYGSLRLSQHLAVNLGLGAVVIETRKTSYSSSGTGTLTPNTTGTGKLTVFEMPISVSGLFGGRRHFFETSLGANFILARKSEGDYRDDAPSNDSMTETAQQAVKQFLIPQLGLGYRYWRENRGLHFRGIFYGMYLTNPTGHLVPYAGVSVGYAFK